MELKLAVKHAPPVNPMLDYSEAPTPPMEPFIVVEHNPGSQLYKVVDDNITSGRNWITDFMDLSFSTWTDEVENLDTSSEEFKYFNTSSRLRWQDVELTAKEFTAPDLERLTKALGNVTFCAICYGDI